MIILELTLLVQIVSFVVAQNPNILASQGFESRLKTNGCNDVSGEDT